MLALDRSPSRRGLGRNIRPITTAGMLAGLNGLFDSKTAGAARSWGEALVRDVEAWQQREARRRDAFSVEQMARRISDECGVSLEYARLASGLMNGGRNG